MTTRRTLRTIDDLERAGLIAAEEAATLVPVSRRYAVAVTPAMARLAVAGPAGTAIRRQFIPDARELVQTPEERADPIGDGAYSPVTGIVHRYSDRALLKLTGLCPVYCRFCFRREMVGPELGRELSSAELDEALAYVARTPAIWEMIVTGGDPLILSPRRISDVTQRLAAIGHVAVVRWHTRVPVVAPERVTKALVEALKMDGKAVYVAIHANHAAEFTPEADAAIARLADAGIALISQTVLLAGINDDVETLAALMRAFLTRRVKPYYLHHPDLAPGTSHFRLSVAEGQEIVRRLRGRLSGLAQPLYVLDVPGGEGKVPIAPSHASLDKQTGDATITDLAGRPHTSPAWDGKGRPGS